MLDECDMGRATWIILDPLYNLLALSLTAKVNEAYSPLVTSTSKPRSNVPSIVAAASRTLCDSQRPVWFALVQVGMDDLADVTEPWSERLEGSEYCSRARRRLC